MCRSLLLSLIFISGSAMAGDAPVVAQTTPASAPAKEVDWFTGNDVSLGGVLFPHLHVLSVYGDTTADELPEIGHHDPRMDGWTLQAIEAGLSGRFNSYLEAFGAMHLYYDRESEEWGREFEEWFGKIKSLPGGFELRGGKYLNRIGFQNQVHEHGWDFIGMPLVNGIFLGDDGLRTLGGEVDWKLPVSWESRLSVSLGTMPAADAEAHEHEHEEGSEHEFEAAGALFDSAFVTANWTNQRDYNDFHQFRGGVSGAWGDNGWGLPTKFYGVHGEYLWRENGYEKGGDSFRWRTEAMWRFFDALSEEAASRRQASFDEVGVCTSLLYGFDSGLQVGVRGEYVSGIAEAGIDQRFRVSPVVSYFFNANRTFYLRAQYDYDRGDDLGEEHSVWLQIGYNWGGPEVR